jgi:hypothetical protein
MEGSLVAYKVFTNGSVLPASDVQTYLMDQSVMVFSNSTTRAAALTAPVEGMLTWLEDLNRYENYNGTAWVVLGNSGLEVVKIQAVGTAVTSVAVTGVFSSTYDNYKIIYSGGTCSTNTSHTLQFGATTAAYFGSAQVVTWSSGSAAILNDNNVSRFNHVGQNNDVNLEVMSPFLARNTKVFGPHFTTTQGGTYSGFLNNSTSYTDFTLGLTSGNITGGQIIVYGYKKA